MASSEDTASSETDDDVSIDSVQELFEFMQYRNLIRKMEAIRRNSPTQKSLDLSNHIVPFAPDWNTDELYESMTLPELLERYHDTASGNPTTMDRLGDALRDGGSLLTELAIKETNITMFAPIPLKAKLMEFIASSTSLETFKFYSASGYTYDELGPGLSQALVANNSIQSLEIRGMVFDEHLFPRLLTKRNSTLRRLELVECTFHDISAEILTDSFARNVGLTYLHWQDNTPHGVEPLLRGIEQHRDLKDFLLTSDNVQGRLLGESLVKCPALETFWLLRRPSYRGGERDNFDSDGFFRNIEKSKSLRKVGLRVQGMYPSSSRAQPRGASTLEEIDLSMCLLPGASHEFSFSHLPVSRSIDLSSSVLRTGVVDSDEVLPLETWSQLFNDGRADSLEKLDLHNCRLRGTDLRHIAVLLGQRHVKIKELNISFNHFGKQDLEFLFDAMKHSPSLEILPLSGPMDIDERETYIHGFALVARLLRNAPKLRSADLTGTTLFVGEYTDEVEQDFVSELRNHEHLESITIDDCLLTPRHCRTLFIGLRGSKSLKTVSARFLDFALLLEDTDFNFVDLLENSHSSLTHLDLEQSRQIPASVASLCQGVGGHQKLRSVHLGMVEFEDDFSDQVCAMLRRNRSLNSLSILLRTWSLPQMELFYRHLFSSLPDFHEVREIEINDGLNRHPIFRTTGEVLLQSLLKNTMLESVSVSLAFLPFALQDKILFYLRLNELGRKLLSSDVTRRSTSLWPNLLAKMRDRREIRHLHYFVHELGSTGLLTPG